MVTSAGMKQSFSRRGPSDRDARLSVLRDLPVPEPNCVFGAAVRAARASGLAKSRFTAPYGADRNRSVARLDGSSMEPSKSALVDGQTCAIVTRR